MYRLQTVTLEMMLLAGFIMIKLYSIYTHCQKIDTAISPNLPRIVESPAKQCISLYLQRIVRILWYSLWHNCWRHAFYEQLLSTAELRDSGKDWASTSTCYETLTHILCLWSRIQASSGTILFKLKNIDEYSAQVSQDEHDQWNRNSIELPEITTSIT